MLRTGEREGERGGRLLLLLQERSCASDKLACVYVYVVCVCERERVCVCVCLLEEE